MSTLEKVDTLALITLSPVLVPMVITKEIIKDPSFIPAAFVGGLIFAPFIAIGIGEVHLLSEAFGDELGPLFNEAVPYWYAAAFLSAAWLFARRREFPNGIL